MNPKPSVMYSIIALKFKSQVCILTIGCIVLWMPRATCNIAAIVKNVT